MTSPLIWEGCACGNQLGLLFETSRPVWDRRPGWFLWWHHGERGGCHWALSSWRSAQCVHVSSHAVGEQGRWHVFVPLVPQKLVSFPKWTVLELVRVVRLVLGILTAVSLPFLERGENVERESRTSRGRPMFAERQGHGAWKQLCVLVLFIGWFLFGYKWIILIHYINYLSSVFILEKCVKP